MRLGVTDYIDCAHTLSGHPKCGQLHGHTYRIELVVEGDASGGMLLDFADLKARLRGLARPPRDPHRDLDGRSARPQRHSNRHPAPVDPPPPLVARFQFRTLARRRLPAVARRAIPPPRNHAHAR